MKTYGGYTIAVLQKSCRAIQLAPLFLDTYTTPDDLPTWSPISVKNTPFWISNIEKNAIFISYVSRTDTSREQTFYEVVYKADNCKANTGLVKSNIKVFAFQILTHGQ